MVDGSLQAQDLIFKAGAIPPLIKLLSKVADGLIDEAGVFVTSRGAGSMAGSAVESKVIAGEGGDGMGTGYRGDGVSSALSARCNSPTGCRFSPGASLGAVAASALSRSREVSRQGTISRMLAKIDTARLRAEERRRSGKKSVSALEAQQHNAHRQAAACLAGLSAGVVEIQDSVVAEVHACAWLMHACACMYMCMHAHVHACTCMERGEAET